MGLFKGDCLSVVNVTCQFKILWRFPIHKRPIWLGGNIELTKNGRLEIGGGYFPIQKVISFDYQLVRGIEVQIGY